MRKRKLLARALNNPAGLSFSEVTLLAKSFGFELTRITGSHHLFYHPAVRELLNLQTNAGKAKAYQVRQMFDLVEKYNLPFEE